jgi:heterogeneous nuclear rnp K-like protein
MPDIDANRKRSRSPSDNEHQKHHKRANTGATSASDDSPASTTAHPSATSTTTAFHDVTMTDPSSAVDDTAASTPSKSAVDIRTLDHMPSNHDGSSATTSAPPSSSSGPPAPPPSAHIHMRCLIVTQDASIIIGKGGSHVNEIREKSGARVMVSESIPGNPERILNVSGPLDAVSKVRHEEQSYTMVFDDDSML